MPDGTIFRKLISLMFLALALKRYACIGFAVGLLVLLFLIIYPKGGITSDMIDAEASVSGFVF